MLGNHADALTSYRKAIELEPDNPETLTRLSAFLDMLGTVGAAAAKRARKAALTTVVTTLPTAERMVYAGKHEGLKNENCKMQIANFGTDANNPLPEREGRIAFVSPHCIVDYSNGAATATRDGLALLAEQGFHCEAFCGTRVDGSRQTSMQETFARLRVAHARARRADRPVSRPHDLHVARRRAGHDGGNWGPQRRGQSRFCLYKSWDSPLPASRGNRRFSHRLRDVLGPLPARSGLDLRRRSGGAGCEADGQAAGGKGRLLALQLRLQRPRGVRGLSITCSCPASSQGRITVSGLAWNARCCRSSCIGRKQNRDRRPERQRSDARIDDRNIIDRKMNGAAPAPCSRAPCLVRHVHQSAGDQGRVCFRADRPRVGKAAAGYSDRGHARPQPRRCIETPALGSGRTCSASSQSHPQATDGTSPPCPSRRTRGTFIRPYSPAPSCS